MSLMVPPVARINLLDAPPAPKPRSTALVLDLGHTRSARLWTETDTEGQNQQWFNVEEYEAAHVTDWRWYDTLNIPTSMDEKYAHKIENLDVKSSDFPPHFTPGETFPCISAIKIENSELRPTATNSTFQYGYQSPTSGTYLENYELPPWPNIVVETLIQMLPMIAVYARLLVDRDFTWHYI